jgi:hypothetical protein
MEQKTGSTVTSVDSAGCRWSACAAWTQTGWRSCEQTSSGFCDELADLAPAVRLRLVAELRAALDEVTTAALTSGMAAAKQEGWGLRRIATFTGVSHEQVRRLLAAPAPAPGSTAQGQG